MKSVCLALMCKNESKYIREALQSVKPYITHWSVFDTGSTDGTQDIVRKEMAGIPGTLTEGVWEGWAPSRTRSIELARQSDCEWILLLDADDTLQGTLPIDLDPRAEYWWNMKYGDMEYSRPQLISSNLKYSYKGCVHEYLSCDEENPPRQALLPLITLARPSRRDILADVKTLEDALKSEPENARYWFYYAQSLRDTLQYNSASDAYLKRASMGGWFEEVSYSLLQVAIMDELQAAPEAVVIDSYLRAWESNPARAESLGRLCDYLNRKNRYTLSIIFAEIAKNLPIPDQRLFVETQYYGWRCLDLFSVAAYWVGRYKESVESCEKLLTSPGLPFSERARVQKNLDFARQKS